MTLTVELPYSSSIMSKLDNLQQDYIITIENYNYKVDQKSYMVCTNVNTNGSGTYRSIVIFAERI